MTSDYIDLLHTSDLLALPPATWLMHTLIPEHGRVGLYGDPGGGKSFIALDWAMHISEGMSWLGRYPTKQAPVIYIAAEGGRGIQKRVREWMRFYGKQDLAAMYWLLEPLYVREEGVVQDFLDTLERRDIFPGLVVFDTLSRSMGNGDENGPDMAHFVDRVIHLASQRFMSALIVHHTNASGSRERGHTAFRANLDAMFSCTPEKNGDGKIIRIALKNNKQKDDVEADTIYVAPSEEVTASLIFVETTPPQKGDKGAPKPHIMGRVDMLTYLAGHPNGLTHSEWRFGVGIDKDRFNRRLRYYKDQGMVIHENGRYVPMPANIDLVTEGDEQKRRGLVRR